MTDSQAECVSAPFDPSLARFIRQTMRRHRITGLSAALVEGTRIVHEQGFGFADKLGRRPATAHTVYRIGSITKVFTGTAVMQLSERGKLDIDAPVFRYVPELTLKGRPKSIEQITPRSIMTHHSGLPADWYDGYWDDDASAFRRVLEYLGESPLAFPPNTVFSYSNLATALLGIVIERTSGVAYQEFITQNILTPLAMRDSFMRANEAPPELRSKAYSTTGEVEEPALRDAPAGAVLSSVRDMSAFMSMVLAGGSRNGVTLLGRSSIDKMLTLQNRDMEQDLGFRIGLNWFLERPALSGQGPLFWHDGGSPHFFSIAIGLRELNLGVVVLSNSDGGMINVGTIAEEILRRAAPSPRKSSRVSPRPSFTSCDDATPSDGFEATLPEKRFASTIGLIELARIGKRTGVQMQGRRFIANTTKSGWHSLSLLLLGKIPLRIGPLASLRIAVRTVGGRSLLGLEQYGLRIPFGSEFTPIPIPAAWAESAGRYRMSNEMLLPPFEELTLSVDRGVLQITATARKAGRLGLVLEPLSDEESVVRGFGRAAGVEVYRSGNDGSQTLRMLGLEFRRM